MSVVMRKPTICICENKGADQRSWPRGGGGGTLKFSVYTGEADFFGVKILNFRIFLGFQKN